MRGYSLMEVLVAALVIGVGALGAVGLQMASSRNTRAALELTLAGVLAEDMVERLVANPHAGYAGVVPGGAPPAFVDCLSRNCSAQQLEAFDVAVWKCSLGRWNEEGSCRTARSAGALPALERHVGLPGGDGTITWGTWGGEGTFTVAVTWQGDVARRLVLAGRR